ncbi:hypothetical protein DFP72DRAFT_1042004 [Ephemerocybe angulata]|uniref:Uncharacterized protein n=1 Tax=Ephemerocybe angulata TaxID=980116 RepID=A0A8H6ICQ9_9AGAR|nr:hypothetical protein DFP72DRAFT_1042004 [Tulosesus angulatus]
MFKLSPHVAQSRNSDAERSRGSDLALVRHSSSRFPRVQTPALPFIALLFHIAHPSPTHEPSSITQGCCADGRWLPVIQMSEDEATLRVLLGFCYPISTHEVPHFTSLTELQSVAEAALKFEMEGVVRYIRHKELVSPRFVEAQPVRVFAIAYLHSWMEEARLAARYTLRHPMPGPYGEELEQYTTMLCGEAASSRASIQESMAISGFDDSDRWVWLECRSCAPMSTGSGRRWSTPFYRRVEAVALETGGLSGLRLSPDSCGVVRGERRLRARDDLESFIQILSVEVEKAISSTTLSGHPNLNLAVDFVQGLVEEGKDLIVVAISVAQ